jgi:hypothetical protein
MPHLITNIERAAAGAPASGAYSPTDFAHREDPERRVSVEGAPGGGGGFGGAEAVGGVDTKFENLLLSVENESRIVPLHW